MHLVFLGDFVAALPARRQRVARVALEEHSRLRAVTLPAVQIIRFDLVEKLGKHAADAPHVARLVVGFKAEAHFGGPIPARANVLRELPLALLRFGVETVFRFLSHGNFLAAKAHSLMRRRIN